nr:MAG TPA_asm: hypothetical protein [Caudoviricetes sp.]
MYNVKPTCAGVGLFLLPIIEYNRLENNMVLRSKEDNVDVVKILEIIVLVMTLIKLALEINKIK